MLTRMRKKVLSELNKCIEEKGVAPTVRELCDNMGLKSASTMHAHLSKLERDGYIEKVANSPRNLRVLKLDDSIFKDTANDNIIICSGETIISNDNKSKSELRYRLYKNDFNNIVDELKEYDLCECNYIDIIYNQITGETILDCNISDITIDKSTCIILTKWTRSEFFNVISKII